MRPSPTRLQTIGAVALIIFCAVVVLYFTWQIHGLIFQVYALTALFMAFRTAPPLVRWLAGFPLLHRVVFYVLIAAVTAGHFTLSTRKYFPFVAWDIFSAVSENETVFCHELIGTTASGKSVRLLVEQHFPSIVQFDLPPTDKPDKMDRLVVALARAYNAEHASDPVREVDLMLMAVKLHPPAGESRTEPSCELLQRYDISSVRSS